jgi:hypothetical protein
MCKIELTNNFLYSSLISSITGNDSMLHVKLYLSRYLLYIGERNCAGPGLPDSSMYFLAFPSELSATQLQSRKRKRNINRMEISENSAYRAHNEKIYERHKLWIFGSHD